MEFLRLKQRLLPQLQRQGTQLSDLIRHEVKGAGLRKDIRDGRRSRRSAFAMLDEVLRLLERYKAQVVAEVQIKPAHGLTRDAYPIAVQAILHRIDVASRNEVPHLLVVMDSRTKSKNNPTVHRLATQKFKSGSASFGRLLETPLFGHSDAHPLLQIADIIASAFMVVCATDAFVGGEATNTGYAMARQRYAPSLQALQVERSSKGIREPLGIKVSDHVDQKPTAELFIV